MSTIPKFMMSDSNLAERFKRLPEMQEQREQEYTQQAKNAHILARRLAQTRDEANRIAIAEIERTRAVQLAELSGQPEWKALQAEKDQLKREAAEWEPRRQAERDRIQREVAWLQRAVDGKLGEMQEAKRAHDQRDQEERRWRADWERLQGQRNRMMDDWELLHRQESSQRGELIEPLQQQLNDLLKTHLAIQAQQQGLQNRLQGLLNLGDFDQRRQEAMVTCQQLMQEREGSENRQTEAEYECNRAKELVNSAGSAIQDQQRLLEQLEAQLADSKAKEAAAEDQLLEAFKVSQQIEQLLTTENARIIQINNDLPMIDRRRVEIRRQIEALLEEERGLDATFDAKQVERANLEAQMKVLLDKHNDARRIHDTAQAAKGITARMTEDKVTLMNEEQARMAELQKKLGEAEEEVQLADSLQKGLRADCDRLDELINRQNGIISDIDAQMSAAKAEYARLQQEWLMLDSQEKDLAQRIGNLQVRLRDARIEAEKPKEQALKLQNDLKAIENQISLLQSRQPPTERSKQQPTWQASTDELEGLKGRLANLQATLEDPASTSNPYPVKLASLDERMAAFDKGIRASWQQNPPPSLRIQLAREAEAVMRAEAAAALEQRQAQIKMEADELAKIHLSKTPRFVIEPEAAVTLLKEHQVQESSPRGDRAIADRVLNMCDLQKIHV